MESRSRENQLLKDKEYERRKNSAREIRRKKEILDRETFQPETEFKNMTNDYGVKIRRIRLGIGDHPEKGDIVEIQYEGRLPNGEIFETTKENMNNIKFVLGRRDAIKGFDLVIPHMKLGEVSELILTPKYAYGEHGNPPKIPGNTILRYEIELTNFYEPQRSKEDMSTKERIAKSDKLRRQGLEEFKDMEYTDALIKFEEAYDFIYDILDLDELENYQETAEKAISLPMSDQMKDKIVSLILNTCNCLNKLEKYEESIERANIAIGIKINPKLFYYRAV